ncbi:acetate kinase [Flavobacteriaceae bacterium UJ101]|nr:acetate kinase [Flavobacteriaceae bacterium UJ101]
MNILVINAGSSSVKYQLIDMNSKQAIAIGLVERIGIEGSRIKHDYFIDGKENRKIVEQSIENHETALTLVANLLMDDQIGVIQNPEAIQAVGHRVVHGGEKFAKTVLINPEVKKVIQELAPLAPLHNPANLTGIEVAEKVFPNAKQVAVFDTSYHQSMPEKAYRYAIPNPFYEKNGIRRYGFHGTSHQFVYNQAVDYLQNSNLKAITLHLGNGASMAAIDSNQVKDTSMGLGPLAGLIMGTRSGDLDPSIIFYMVEELGLTLAEVKNILNKESGMLGITESSDARDIEEKYYQKEAKAILGNEMYAYRIKKYIGSYIAALNGVDTLIFTGGIGENDALMRSLICKNLDSLGIQLDENLNKERNHASKIEEIHVKNTGIQILIIPTNEELQIANETASFI